MTNDVDLLITSLVVLMLGITIVHIFACYRGTRQPWRHHSIRGRVSHLLEDDD